MARANFLLKSGIFAVALILPAIAIPAFHAYGVANVSKAAPSGEKDQKAPFTISDNVNLVLLDVLVKSSKGGFVTGLEKQNFSVFEDGQQRPITHFSSVDTPVSVGLVVDNSGSMRNKKADVIMAGLSFAHQSNSNDEFFVVNFNNSVTRGLPPKMMFTDNINELRSALYYGQPVGQTALYDAIAYSLKHLEYAHHEKRTLIVVSDGGDNVSSTTVPEVMKMIEASRASIYTVGIYDPDDPTLNPGVLRKIAAVSGGEFFEPQKLDDVLPIFDKISQDIRNTYTIGYVPCDDSDRRVLRTVKVTAQEDGQRLTVHTRTSYITTPLSDLLAQQAKNNTQTDMRQ